MHNRPFLNAPNSNLVQTISCEIPRSVIGSRLLFLPFRHGIGAALVRARAPSHPVRPRATTSVSIDFRFAQEGGKFSHSNHEIYPEIGP